MVGPNKAENVFGQMLICLRMSRLDYMVKETPYSAYITIRKKFSKSVKEDIVDLGNAEDENDIAVMKNIKKENTFLKQKIEELEKECGSLRFDNEEMEIKVENLEKENVTLEDQIEELYAESRNLRKNMEKLSVDNSFKEKEFEKICNEKEDLKISIKELKSFEASTSSSTKHVYVCKECESESEEDTEKHIETSNEVSTSSKGVQKYDKCNFTGNEKNIEIHVNEVHAIVKFNCDVCDFNAKSEEVLKNHRMEHNEVTCEHCGESFIGSEKLGRHLCRKFVPDPEYIDMYVKNWFRRGDCIPVFSKRWEKEIVLLHSDNCWDGENFCSDIPENFDASEKSIVDNNGLLHGSAKKSGSVRSDGSVCWLAVLGLMTNKMDWYHVM